MVDNQKIVLSGEGDQAPGLEAGDVVIILDEKKHDVFKYVPFFALIFWTL